MKDDEVVLAGGNMTLVVRVGDTVRRAVGPWTPAIHALLDHLHRNGFTQVPKAIGLDEKSREIISFLPGTVATYPLSEAMLSDRTLTTVAETLRLYHDATANFVPPEDVEWQWPAHEPREVLCHNDFCPYNLMWDGDHLVGVIDFDTASPGPRVWDMAYTAYRFVPLTGPDNPDVPYPGIGEQRRRLDLFCDAYGVPEINAARVVATTVRRLRELVAFIVDQATAGDAAQQAVLDRGDTKIYERDIAYLERNEAAFA